MCLQKAVICEQVLNISVSCIFVHIYLNLFEFCLSFAEFVEANLSALK